MSGPACKVVICSGDANAAVDQLADIAGAVQRGEINATPEVEAALNEAAKCLDRATASLRKASKAAMAAAFS